MRLLARTTGLIGLMLALLVSGARGDQKTNADYTLGPDDVIDVSVSNHSDLNKTLVVLPNGKIAFPEIGELQAAGKTPEALAAEIRTGLEKTLNAVDVVISVVAIRSRRVNVIGAVKAPGVYELKQGWKALDLIAAAGGLSAKPSLVTGRLIRTGSGTIPLNVADALSQPDSEANRTLEPGDLILLDQIAPGLRSVYVMGQVKNPGAYELQEGANPLWLIVQAGNPTEAAALSQAYILRGTVQMPLDLRQVLIEGKADDAVTHFPLQPADLLFIPKIEQRIAVMGQVRNPGYFLIPDKEKLTVLSAINLAGGQAPEGDLSKAAVLRSVDGKAYVMPVNVDTLLKKGDLKANIALEPNDIVYVPSRGAKRFGWGDVLGTISAIGLLGFRLGR